MWRKFFTVIFSIVLMKFQESYTKVINQTKYYCMEPDCLQCGANGCEKCFKFIVNPSRKCVNECPFGYLQNWSTMVDFMGIVCTHNGNFLGLSSGTLTVLIGILSGIILCIILFVMVFFYITYRRRKIMMLTSSSSSCGGAFDTSSEIDDNININNTSPEKRRDFLKQLETLRPYSQCYLDMLNDTRQQIRQLHREGDNNAIGAYKPVVRDLAKILLLLNKPIDNNNIIRIMPDDDWEHLFNWAEKALKRYKRMSDDNNRLSSLSSQPQVAQLINFLQSPPPAPPTIHSSDTEDAEYLSVRGSTTMSTFKPDQPSFGSSLSLQNVAIKGFSTNYDKYPNNLNPEWKFEYTLVGSSSEFDPMAWKNSKEFLSGSPLFLEDDFHQLGFRPQDEITTEL